MGFITMQYKVRLNFNALRKIFKKKTNKKNNYISQQQTSKLHLLWKTLQLKALVNALF